MTYLLASVGATAAAIVELSLGPYLGVGGVHPHPVLVFGVIWTIALGVESGFVWAFVGGIALDSLAARPLGVSSFALLVAIAGAALIARSFIRVRPIAPLVAVPILSVLFSILAFVLLGAIRPPVIADDPIAVFMPGAVYDAVLGLLFGPLLVSIRDRRMADERVDW